jgi:ubiquitin related modifier 1
MSLQCSYKQFVAKSGGMELLFQNVSKHTIQFPAKNNEDKKSTLQDLIFYIRDNMMTEKKDLFVDKDTV